MSETNIHYLLAVRAPGIGLNMLRSGAWFTMANDADLAALEDRKLSVIPALAAFRGQVAIFQLPLDNPDGAVVVWLHGADKPPDFKHMLTPTGDQRDTFWAYIDHYHQRIAALSAPPVPAQTIEHEGEPVTSGGSLKWWLLGAAVCLGLMGYAVVPEFFKTFNWQGRLYDTVE